MTEKALVKHKGQTRSRSIEREMVRQAFVKGGGEQSGNKLPPQKTASTRLITRAKRQSL